MTQRKSMSLIEFQEKFNTEEACQEHLFRMRWPQGYTCLKCGHTKYYFIVKRHLYQCTQCNYQASLTANTVMHKTRTKLKVWFWMIYLLGRDKRGKSTLALSKELKINYPKAWAMTQKIRVAMAQQDAHYQLAGLVEVDECYFGGTKSGGKRGRGTEKPKALLEISLTRDGKPKYAKIQIIDQLNQKTVQEQLNQFVKTGSVIQTDGYRIYSKVYQNGYARKAMFSKNLKPSELLKWIHILIGNVKTFTNGTFHGLEDKHRQRYLDEFCYRFNRRFWEPQLFDRLLNACVSTNSLTMLS